MGKSKEEVEKILKEYFKDNEVFKFMSVQDVNHNPHPFMIGPRHIKHANDKHSGMLTEEVCKEVGCAHPGCNVAYDDHTSDRIGFLQLKRNAKNFRK